MELSCDEFLEGRAKLFQPKKGYRVSSDTVLLAATLAPMKGQKIIDIGAGTGGIMTFYKIRSLENNICHALELRDDMIELAQRNASVNGLADKITYYQGDLGAMPKDIEPNSYDHLVTNPPYLDQRTGSKSPYETKAAAHRDGDLDLKTWISCCLKLLKQRGYITLIHRADRLSDILAAFEGKAGDIIIYPLWSGEAKDPKRIIVRARKSSIAPLSLKNGLILHTSKGSFTDKAENILRHNGFLDISE
jgi:tRNA1(Val) A37 N6-methylase TrmN6